MDQNHITVKRLTNINGCSAESNPTTNNFSNLFTVKMSLIVTSNVHGYDIIKHKSSCFVV